MPDKTTEAVGELIDLLFDRLNHNVGSPPIWEGLVRRLRDELKADQPKAAVSDWLIKHFGIPLAALQTKGGLRDH
jgi:hypothetical protein